MRIIPIILIVINFAPALLCAQEHNNVTVSDMHFQPRLAGEVYTPSVLYAGSPWFNDNWLEGIVYLNNGERVDNVLLRYNGFLDELFWLTPYTFESVKLDKFMISGFILYSPEKESEIRFKLMETSGWLTAFTSKVFMQVLAEGDVSLYAHRKIRETGGTTSKIISGLLVPRRMIGPDYKYYLAKNDAEPRPVQLRRRSLLRAFPKIGSELREALRHNGLHVRNESQLRMAVEIINEIISETKQ